MSNIRLKTIDLFNNTTSIYDQTKTTYVGKISTKTIDGKTAVGAPIVKYRNSAGSSEAITPSEVTLTNNNRCFAITSESGGLATIVLYDLDLSSGELTYVGKISVTLPEPPSTTYAYRGFRVVDAGTSGWKIFILVTANVAAHSGLYLVDNLSLSDFTVVPPVIPTATLPGQKAVYRYDTTGPVNILDGTGLGIDQANTTVYVHRGVSAAHYYTLFDYSSTVTTVGALGQTTDTFVHSTGNLPALTGALLLTNSEEICNPNSGPNSGQDCIFFSTSSTIYRGRLSDLTSATTSWPTLEVANNQGPLNSEAGTSTTVRAAYLDSIDRVALLINSTSYPNSITIKDFVDFQKDINCVIEGSDNNQNLVSDMRTFKFSNTPVAFDGKGGFLVAASSLAGQSGIYTANIDSDDIYDLNHIISPVLEVSGQVITRFTASFSRPDLASPLKVYYRTSGFGTAAGGWIAVSDDLDFGSLSSTTGEIQIKIAFRPFVNSSTNPLQLLNAGLILFDNNSISENWEYSHDDSTPGNPSRVAFRLKKQYASSVPDLTFRARDLSDNLYVQSTTNLNPGLFQYSTDGGVNWLSLGTIPNTVGTLLRYTFAVPPGIDVRPSIRES